MKPPTFRQKRRYLLVRTLPPWRELDSKVIHSAVLEAATSLWGDGIAGVMQPVVVCVGSGFFIARCTRGEDDRLATAISTVTSVGGRTMAFRTIARSGTILALRRRIARMPLRWEEFVLEAGGEALMAVRYSGEKIDLIEEGIKKKKLLFFTDKESEEV